MKIFSLIAVCFFVPLAALAQPVDPGATNAPDADPSRPSLPPAPAHARDEAWQQMRAAVSATSGAAMNKTEALSIADRAKNFHTQFPNDSDANEARKLEALFLIQAVEDGGDAPTQGRMHSTVQAFRGDKSVPAFQRAVVTGTYEFKAARARIHSLDDLLREYDGVARKLIEEFPDQPQGYVSLLTQADRREDSMARSMTMEVVNAGAAPLEVRNTARQFVTRLDLVGQPVETVFGDIALGASRKSGWPSGKAGLIYFWATWSPDSLALGERIAGGELARINVVGVCLDADAAAAAKVAAARNLPGQLVYAAQDGDGGLAARLGADRAPLLYLVDVRGQFKDVRGLKEMDAKLAELGL